MSGKKAPQDTSLFNNGDALKTPDVNGGDTGARDYAVGEIPFVSHLTELRNRLIYSVAALLLLTALLYPLSDVIYALLARPLVVAMNGEGRMIFTALPEVFLTYLKLSFFGAVMIGFPFILFQLWRFVAPGLYAREKSSFRILFVATPLLFYVGAAFVYVFIFPLAWDFFLSFQSQDTALSMPIAIEPKVDEYLGLSMKMLFAFGLAFELPVLLYVLSMAGLVTGDMLKKGRKYALIIIFAVAALITPPDIISQIAIGVPMILLYEATLFLLNRSDKSKKNAEATSQ